MQVPGCLNSLTRCVKVWSSEHVGVAPLLAEVDREGVAGPHRLQPRVLVDARLRDDRTRIGIRRRLRQRLAAAVARAYLVGRAHIGVVLQREVLSPDRRIDGLVRQFHDPEKRVLRLLLPLDDVDEQRDDRRRRDGGEKTDRQDGAAATLRVRACVSQPSPRFRAGGCRRQLHVSHRTMTADAGNLVRPGVRGRAHGQRERWVGGNAGKRPR